MKSTNRKTKIYSGLFLFGVAGLLSKTYGADTPAVSSGAASWQKPVCLTDLSLGVKESYDDNLLLLSGNGKVPYFDSTYASAYHWNAIRQLGLDLGGKVLETDCTGGNDYLGATQPSHRDDMEYELSAGVTCTFTEHLSANLAYTYDVGANAMSNLPANLGPEYCNFEHQVASLGLQYKF